MSEVKLSPLPEGEAIGWSQAWSHDQMRDYARANMEPLIAENERLRAKYQRAAESSEHFAARAERLAEALRGLLDVSDKFTGDPDEDAATWVAANDAARAALDQARGKGGAGNGN